MRRPALKGRVTLEIVSRSRQRKRLIVTALVILIGFVLCIRITSSVRVRLFKHNNSQTGIASFYGRDFHGKQTASGEIFNMRRCSAAHRTLPFGTLVRVTNVSNGKRLIVKVNDRGPFVSGRIIDLSYGAAKRLDMIEQGITKVNLEYYLSD